MLKLIATTVVALMLTSTSYAADLIMQNSPHSVQTTMDKLVTAVEGAGAFIAARIDHTENAKKVGIDLAPNQLLIFGNPKIGSPIFKENPAAGLDLPIRVSVYKDGKGKTIVAYHSPAELAANYKLPADMKSLKMMTGALAKLTSAAIAP